MVGGMFSDLDAGTSGKGTRSPYLVSIEEAIAEIRAGRMIILMDDEDRENEGDLCMAAEKVTPEAIAFMARFARGLICLPLSEEKLAELGLPMMVAENRTPLGTAFTLSIDARRGVTSGISAADRATTILTALRDGAGGGDVVSPGHVFPLRARRGGVLVRTGQTEGAVDLARLAGLKPAGVICEIMKDDGSMARLADLETFAATHGLKIATVADLVQYRLRHDSLVHRIAEARLPTRFGGDFRAVVYGSDVDEGEHLALVRGTISPDEPTLVRTHAEYLPGDVFGYVPRNTGAVLQRAMEVIAAEGKGVILYLRREAQGVDLFTDGDGRTQPAREPSTNPSTRLHDFRDYGIGAQILRDLGVGKIRLLTNYPRRLISLPGYGLEIVECVPLSVEPPAPAPHDTASRVAKLR
jgi:3,4-dihydroxy 2-butanone 4-phosphate synthase/GTP cyclohydrolase II